MKGKLKKFTDLVVWQLASNFSKEIAQLVKTFPSQEKYMLIGNFLRAARSIPANISEGYGRYQPADKIRFYNIAEASADEFSNHLIEAFNNHYINENAHDLFQKKLHIISVKLTNLIVSTRKRLNSKLTNSARRKAT